MKAEQSRVQPGCRITHHPVGVGMLYNPPVPGLSPRPALYGTLTIIHAVLASVSAPKRCAVLTRTMRFCVAIAIASYVGLSRAH